MLFFVLCGETLRGLLRGQLLEPKRVLSFLDEQKKQRTSLSLKVGVAVYIIEDGFSSRDAT